MSRPVPRSWGTIQPSPSGPSAAPLASNSTILGSRVWLASACARIPTAMANTTVRAGWAPSTARDYPDPLPSGHLQHLANVKLASGTKMGNPLDRGPSEASATVQVSRTNSEESHVYLHAASFGVALREFLKTLQGRPRRTGDVRGSAKAFRHGAAPCIRGAATARDPESGLVAASRVQPRLPGPLDASSTMLVIQWRHGCARSAFPFA